MDLGMKDKFEMLFEWLRQEKAFFDNLFIRQYNPNHRGVHAKCDIDPGETMINIPLERIITLQMAVNSPLGRIMLQKGLNKRLNESKNIFLGAFILQEFLKPEQDRNYHEYLQILPSCQNFPIFFNSDELEYLKGTQIPPAIEA